MEAAVPSVSLFEGLRHVPPPRRRGGQPGNRNRLRHGGFSKAARARRAAVRALIRKMDRLIVLARALHAADAMQSVAGASKCPPPGLRPYSPRFAGGESKSQRL